MKELIMLTDKYTIRKQNEAMVLEQIILENEISRAHLSKITHLNKATISEITKKQLENQLIIETGIGDSSSSGGRKPILLRFNEQSAMVISIDLGYDYISSGIHYLNGDIIEKNFSDHQFPTQENAVSSILDIVEYYQTKYQQTYYGIVGLTIAIHGIVDQNQIVFTPNYDLDQLALHQELAEQLDYPVFLENEANLTAIAEATFSSHHQHLVSISIHSGIGAGIIINGRLFTGPSGKAGEIGHMILIPDGKLCPCGNHGCIEQYASEKAILQQYAQLTKKENCSLQELKFDLEQGDMKATAFIKQAAKYLSIGINDLIVAFAPDVIFINSPLVEAIPDFTNMIQNEITSKFSKGIDITSSKLGYDAILFGGASVAIRAFLGIQQLNLQQKEACTS